MSDITRIETRIHVDSHDPIVLITFAPTQGMGIRSQNWMSEEDLKSARDKLQVALHVLRERREAAVVTPTE